MNQNNNFNTQGNNSIPNNQSFNNNQNLNNNVFQNQNTHQNQGVNQMNFGAQYHNINNDSFVQNNQNTNTYINQQVNEPIYSPNQSSNNNIGDKNKNKKIGIIIMISTLVIILLVIFVILLPKDKNNSNINNNGNILNNKDKIEYNEVLNNFAFFNNELAFTANNNITLNRITEGANLYLYLKANYANQIYNQIKVGVYDSYDAFKSYQLYSDDNIEYLINNNDEMFLIVKTDKKITYALYGYAFNDNFISLSYNNNIGSDNYMDISLDNIKTVFNLCKETISLNNNYLNINNKI